MSKVRSKRTSNNDRRCSNIVFGAGTLLERWASVRHELCVEGVARQPMLIAFLPVKRVTMKKIELKINRECLPERSKTDKFLCWFLLFFPVDHIFTLGSNCMFLLRWYTANQYVLKVYEQKVVNGPVYCTFRAK